MIILLRLIYIWTVVNNLGSLNAAEKENVMELKPEDNTDIPFEIIYTGNDDIAGEYSEMQHVDDVGSNASQNTGGSRDSDSNADIDNQVTVKCEPKVEIEDETVDLPLQMFDPNNMTMLKLQNRWKIKVCPAMVKVGHH